MASFGGKKAAPFKKAAKKTVSVAKKGRKKSTGKKGKMPAALAAYRAKKGK